MTIQKEYRENFIKGLKKNICENHTKKELSEIICKLIDRISDNEIEFIADLSDTLYYNRVYSDYK